MCVEWRSRQYIRRRCRRRRHRGGRVAAAGSLLSSPSCDDDDGGASLSVPLRGAAVKPPNNTTVRRRRPALALLLVGRPQRASPTPRCSLLAAKNGGLAKLCLSLAAALPKQGPTTTTLLLLLRGCAVQPFYHTTPPSNFTEPSPSHTTPSHHAQRTHASRLTCQLRYHSHAASFRKRRQTGQGQDSAGRGRPLQLRAAPLTSTSARMAHLALD